MPNTANKHKLINIETDYQKLKYRLDTFGSTRIKLEYLRKFLDELARKNNHQEYYSYFDELIQNYIELITTRNLEYRSIDVLMSLKLLEETFIDLNIKATRSADFKNIHKILLNQIALTSIYLGEWQQALRVFFLNLKQNDFNRVYSNLSNNIQFPSDYNIYQKLINAIGKDTLKKNKAVATTLNTLEEWESLSKKTQNDKAWIMLIEYESQDVFGNNKKENDIVSIGNIQQLFTNSHNLLSDSAEDLVLFNNLSISYNDLLHQQAVTAIKVAKNNLGKHISNLHDKHNVIFSFSNKTPNYFGDSIGLAMSLSVISSLSRNNDYDNKYSLLQDYCMTGSISNDGRVRAISEKALAIKLDTIFYSPFKKILIPKANQKQAVEHLKTFKEKYPQRDLEIIAIDNIKSAINNTNIILKEKISLKNKSKRIIVKRVMVVNIVIATILVWSTILFLKRNVDHNPVKLKVGVSKIVASNINDHKLWEYDFGVKLDNLFYTQKNNENISPYVFNDLDNDGLNDLIIGMQPNEKGESGGVYVFSANGKLLWKYDEHPQMTFGEENFCNIYTIENVKIHSFGGEKKIMASFCKYIWYPSRFVAFDIDGNVLGEYWNSGVARVSQFIDIDDDGIDEIFLAGCNNGFNKGFIAILEHDKIAGHSPQLKKAYIPQGIPKGSEKYYIRFPDPQDFLINNKRGSIVQIEAIGDKILAREQLSGDNLCSVYYTLNKNFEITSLNIRDAFMANYTQRTGRDFLTDYPEIKLKEMFYNLEFWDGEKFVPYPTMSNPD